MDYEWSVSGMRMEYEWNINGIRMEYEWNEWYMNRVWTKYEWYMNGIWVECEWNLNGIWMEYEWNIGEYQQLLSPPTGWVVDIPSGVLKCGHDSAHHVPGYGRVSQGVQWSISRDIHK
jgi:hypothetical protein